MKTFKYLGIALLAGSFLFTACTKDEVLPPSEQQNSEIIQSTLDPPTVDYKKNWTDNFSYANCLAERWNLYGYPQSGWVPNACGRKGLFINNGLYPQGSFAVSKMYVGSSAGYTIESDVCIDRQTNSGIVVSSEIGVSRHPNSAETGISMRLIYFGYHATNVPPEYQNKTFLVMKALADGGNFMYSGNYTYPVGIFPGSWHKMQIRIDQFHFVSFILDNVTIWKPEYPLDNSMLQDNHVVLGYTSPGTIGKAYHDYMKVMYPTPD
ncbi:MAG: hypothetical protein IPH20_15605 [Bacteroidales bacterium]|nr:hypothetical protein [Bacteroidales bacterium]